MVGQSADSFLPLKGVCKSHRKNGAKYLDSKGNVGIYSKKRDCLLCEHGRRRSVCKECGGSQICEHGRVRSKCKECGGASICEHGRQRPQCKECGGSQICEHGRIKRRCKDCKLE